MTYFGDSQFQEYLDGSRFSAEVRIVFPVRYERRTRQQFLREYCAGKKVLHIGCCDHTPLLREKIEAGVWLHGLLTEGAADCVGIDIDADSVAAVRKATGLTNVHVGDVTKPGLQEILSYKWDIVVFGEVLEHIGNPVAFLRSFAANYGRSPAEIAITVPNARKARNFLDTIKNVERINSDHRFDFTPYTLSKVLSDGGCQVNRLLVLPAGSPSPVKTLLLRTCPMFGDSLLAIGQFATRPDQQAPYIG